MSKNNVALNYIYNLMYQLLLIVLPLVTTPYISRVLGAEGIGVYSYTISIITYFVLFGSLGISMYAQREIAYVQDEKVRRGRIFWESFFLRCITLCVAMVVFYFILCRQGEYAHYYRVLLFYILANVFDISYFFQGMEEFKKLVARNLVVKLLSIISVFVFIKTPQDVGKYLLIYSLSNLIGNLSLWFYLPKYIIRPNLKRMSLTKHIKPTLIMFLPQIATQIYTVLDKAMLGTILSDKAEVGYYEQSQKITVILLTLITSLGTVMLPHISNMHARGKADEIKQSLVTSFRLVFMFALPMIFGISAIARDLMPWFLGDGYEKTVTIIVVISPIILMIGLSNVVGIQYLLPTKRQFVFTLSVATGAVMNLVLNLLLIPAYKSIGSAISTVIAETSVLLVQVIFVWREFNFKKIALSATKYLISAIVMFVVILFINRFCMYTIARTLRILFDVLAGVTVYMGMLVLTKDKLVFFAIDKVLKRNK